MSEGQQDSLRKCDPNEHRYEPVEQSSSSYQSGTRYECTKCGESYWEIDSDSSNAGYGGL